MPSKAQIEATKRYLKSFEEIKFRVKKGTRSRYKAAAQANGKSFNAYVVDLIEKDISGNPKTAHLAADDEDASAEEQL